MHNLLLRFRVNQRLTAAFCALILITCAIAGTGLWALARAGQQLDRIVTETMVKTRYSNDMLDANNQVVAAVQALLLEADPTRRHLYTERVLEHRKAYDTSRNAMFAMPSTEQGRKVLGNITVARDAARQLNQGVIDLALAGDTTQALQDFVPAQKATAEWQQRIRDNIAYQQQQAELAYAEASAQAAIGRRVLISGSVLAIVLSALLAYFITRSLVLPLRAATAAADRIAAGNLEGHILVEGRDETADLQRSMASMQTRLTQLIDAQRDLCEQQVQGQMSHRIDAAAFPAAFGHLMQASNALAEHNSRLIAQILATASSYSVGDLEVRMPSLPGEQASITAAMETTRDNLLHISSDIKRLAAGAARGDFSQRGDEGAFEHVFAEIVTDLNALFTTCEGSLGDISRLLAGLAAGDLTQHAEGRYEGVFAHMCASANQSAGNLRSIISGIQASTEVISTSASEIASGNSDLSQRTEQQAANLEETAASMEELTSTVRQNAEHARQAHQLTRQAEASVAQGGEAVTGIVATMERIDAASRRVGEIISVIDGIAFQTNILALNAAVEAARAGEQGRGFAVVASEVRSLAQRSAGAAKDVKELIDGSSEQVRSGVERVREAGTRMDEIAQAIGHVRAAVGEIAAASQEQSAGIEQVNQAVVHMDEVTQQNAALVEEASAASRALQEQAERLDTAVAVFKVA